MNKKIIAWSDASVKDDWGVAVAYHATVVSSEGVTERFSDSQYIDQEIITTRAEYMGCMYAVSELFHQLENAEEYHFILYCDSQGTVEKIQKDSLTDKLERTMRHYTSKFNTFNVGWVSRQMNEEADALAKAALERGNNAV